MLAAATISAADLGGRRSETALSVTYVVIATALVTVPVVLAIVFGTRAEEWMTDVQALARGPPAADDLLSAHRARRARDRSTRSIALLT